MKQNIVDDSFGMDFTTDQMGEKVNLGIMKSEIDGCSTDSQWYLSLCDQAYNARMCAWAGQTGDGRKWKEFTGNEVFPWDGAGDSQVRMVDEVINFQVAQMKEALFRGKFSSGAQSLRGDDIDYCQKISKLIQWQFWNNKRGMMRRVLEMSANYRQTFGASFTYVCWDQKTQIIDEVVDFQNLGMLVAQSLGATDEMQVMSVLDQVQYTFSDPLRQKEAVQMVQLVSPIVDGSKAKRIVKELRETGTSVIPFVDTVQQGPRFKALIPFVDVFCPIYTDDIQDARFVNHIEYISEPELRNRIDTEGYDEEFVDKACQHKGQTWWSGLVYSGILQRRNYGYGGFAAWGSYSNFKDLIEINHYYHKSWDGSKGNTPALWRTVFSRSVNDRYGKNEIFPYEHQEYPYILHCRERLDIAFINSRGMGNVLCSSQAEVKIQHDARINRSDIVTVPPLKVPPMRAGHNIRLGPGAMIPQKPNEDYKWMEIPPYDGTSLEVEQAIQKKVDQYVGYPSEFVPEMLSSLKQQNLINDWLLECSDILSQSYKLMVQYYPEEFMQRIAGPSDKPFKLDRDEIQLLPDFSIAYDVRDMNMELIKQKTEILQLLVPIDKSARINYGEFVSAMLSAVDPWMAQRIIQPEETSMQNEVQAEQSAIIDLMSGIEPPMVEGGGVNYQIRLQRLDQWAQNPDVQRQIQSNPVLQKMLEAHVQNLQFGIQQQENAQTGRVGAQPVMPNNIG